MKIPGKGAIQSSASDTVFSAIADPTRRRLLDMLSTDSRCVTELAEPFGMTRPAISQHLRILLDAKLISVSKAGRQRRYSLRPEHLKLVYDWVAHYQVFWAQKLTNLGNYLDKQK